MWQVVDNVTGQPASKAFGTEEGAAFICRGLNLQSGPGGRYGVREAPDGSAESLALFALDLLHAQPESYRAAEVRETLDRLARLVLDERGD